MAFVREQVFAALSANPGNIIAPVTNWQKAGVDDETSEYALNFCDLNLPGVIAGGIGKTQTSYRRGANTNAAHDDFRDVRGILHITSQKINSEKMRLTIMPSLTFHVTDTVDFCPGNPGGWRAELLTIPLSRWEASEISGDVTFQLDFDAPAINAVIILERKNGVVNARDASILE